MYFLRGIDCRRLWDRVAPRRDPRAALGAMDKSDASWRVESRLRALFHHLYLEAVVRGTRKTAANRYEVGRRLSSSRPSGMAIT